MYSHAQLLGSQTGGRQGYCTAYGFGMDGYDISLQVTAQRAHARAHFNNTRNQHTEEKKRKWDGSKMQGARCKVYQAK